MNNTTPGALGSPGARKPRGSPEALDKSPGVVFHAEFDFQGKTSQYMVKMTKNTAFMNFFLYFCLFGGSPRVPGCPGGSLGPWGSPGLPGEPRGAKKLRKSWKN